MKTIARMMMLFFLCAGLLTADDYTGFSAGSAQKQRELEQRITESISPQRIEQHLKWLTSRPHRAGTEGARITADYILQQMKEYGFDAEIVRYDAFLPAPISTSLELTQPVQEKIPTTEDRIEGDPFTENVAEHPGWNGYSPSGEANGQVVYAHYGSHDDFQKLRELGIDLKGKIVLMRYFGTGEGRKVRNAELAGAAGVILYTDPEEDGFKYGDVYPRGNWRPPGSIMRRSLLFTAFEGEPLSPGWASKAGAKRLRPEDAQLPKIPVLPISYRSAERILRLLEGPVAPYEWQGALGLTYKIGAGPAAVRLRTEMDNRDHPILNIVAQMKGSTIPDQWVVLGNHHDAWIYGAGDPSSGTAALLTLAESIGKLAREGHRPKRTLVLTFWDAEEMMLGGSTEWVEDHEQELLQKAVACINMDSAVFNTDRPLSVAAHPTLHNLFRETSRAIPVPRTKRTLFETWRDLQNEFRLVPGVDGWGEFFDATNELTQPYVFEAPSDDAAPFYNRLALPASDMYYGADYGMYHSIYENFHWMKTVVDPTFEYHKVMALLQGFVGLRLANADILPLDYATEASFWRVAFQDLVQIAEKKKRPVTGYSEALKLIDQWETEATELRKEIEALLADPAKSKAVEQRYVEINYDLYQVARNFYRSGGRPDATGEKNLFTGSSYEYANASGSSLPGIRLALDQNKFDEAESELQLYTAALQKRIQSLQSLRKSLQKN